MSMQASIVGTFKIVDNVTGETVYEKALNKKSVTFEEIAGPNRPNLADSVTAHTFDVGNIGTASRVFLLDSDEKVELTDINGTTLGANDIKNCDFMLCFGDLLTVIADMKGSGQHHPLTVIAGD